MNVEVTDEMLTAFREAVRQGGDSTDDIRRAGIEAALELVSDCRACPAGCPSCSRDGTNCECYQHADRHPMHRAESALRALRECARDGRGVTVADVEAAAKAFGWVI